MTQAAIKTRKFHPLSAVDSGRFIPVELVSFESNRMLLCLVCFALGSSQHPHRSCGATHSRPRTTPGSPSRKGRTSIAMPCAYACTGSSRPNESRPSFPSRRCFSSRNDTAANRLPADLCKRGALTMAANDKIQGRQR